MLGGVVPAGGPVVAETVPYAVLDVGQEELKCPVCHWQFKTNYRLRKAHGHPQGVWVPLLFLPQVSDVLQDAKAAQGCL